MDTENRAYLLSGLIFTLLLLIMVRSAAALDTVETFDKGATDLESYFSIDRVGIERENTLIAGELVSGFGLLNRFSAYFGASYGADLAMAQGTGAYFVGAFGTPVDSDHIDLDLILNFEGGNNMVLEPVYFNF